MSFTDPATVNTVNDVTASRAINGTVYTNTSGNTLYVSITILHTITVAGGGAYANSQTDIGVFGACGITNAPVMAVYGSLYLVVPPNGQYKVASTVSNGTNALLKWIEVY